MADLKISQLTALTGANVVATDVLPIVDVSETTTKKIAASELVSYVTRAGAIGSAARPLIADGAYLSGSGLVLNGPTANYAGTPDSATVSITGDIFVWGKLSLTDWTPAADQNIITKFGAAGNRSWRFFIGASGYLSFGHTSDGTTEKRVDVLTPSVSDGQTLTVGVYLDVDNGSGGHDVKFYTSNNDGVTWTQFSTTITTAGVTSIFDSTSSVDVGTRASGGAGSINGTIYAAGIKSGGPTGTSVFDANFSTQTADALAFNATSDAGIKADGLVLKGVVGQNATVPDSAALSITGDIDIKVRATVPDWTPTTTAPLFLAKRQDGGNQQSFSLELSASGVLTLTTSPNGTGPSSLYTSSTAIVGATDGTAKWVRATMDVNDGAGNRVTKFYTSDNGTTWTQLGTTVTAVGATSIFDSSIPLEIGSRNAGVNNLMNGTIHRVIIQSAYDTADNTTSLVFDADFDAQAIGTTSFVESSSNAAVVTMNNTNPTVTINTTRYSYGMPNLQSGTISIATLSADVDRYQRFVITKATVVDMALIEVTTGPVSASTVHFGLYAANANLQPIGNVLLTTNLSVGAGATGVFTKQFTPVTLQPGTYLLATSSTVTMSVRVVISGEVAVLPTYGATGSIAVLVRSRTSAAFGNNPSPWEGFQGSAPNGLLNYALLRWREA